MQEENTLKRCIPLVLAVFVAVGVVQASATNLLMNGSFEDGTFNHWTLGTTSNGTAGVGFPIVTQWPLDNNVNAWEGQVGQIDFLPNDFEGATLSQTFNTAGGAASLSFSLLAMGGPFDNGDGGDFRLLLDGSTLAAFDVGAINANQVISGTLSAYANLSAGTHTFEIDVLRPFQSGGSPYQYVTGADVEVNGVPEPGSLVLMGSGVLGLAGVLRRKLGF